MDRRSSLAGNWALAVLSVATLLGVLELVLRLTLATPAPSGPRADAPDPLRGLPRLRLADLTRPNRDGVFAGRRLRTNALGFRGPDVAPAKPPGTYRVVVIGDSVTMGQGVDDHETYAALVAAAANERSERKVEVLNLGVSAFDVRSSVNRLRRLGLALDPDLVIYGFSHNDLERLPGYRVTHDQKRFAEWAEIDSILWRKSVMGWFYLRDCFHPHPSSYIYELEENYFRNPQVWDAFTRELRNLRRVTEERGICLAILIHAAVEDANWLSPFPRLSDRVEAGAEALGIPVIRARPLFRKHAESDLRVGITDPHPNALGHRLYAEALLDALRRLPERCGVPGI